MTAPTPGDTARELAQAMTRLRARLRAESVLWNVNWTWSQMTTLARISNDGPTTASALAAAEHVRPQSMAETIGVLKGQGLVTSEPDPSDRRKSLISATAEGRELAASLHAVRETWLEAVLAQVATPAERRTLIEAAAIMQRLADCDSHTPRP
jgi:DNA-binding MarR family transcriptional regulator